MLGLLRDQSAVIHRMQHTFVEKVGLVLEVVVQSRLVEAKLGRDLIERGGVKATAIEGADRRLDHDKLALLVLIAPIEGGVEGWTAGLARHWIDRCHVNGSPRT